MAATEQEHAELLAQINREMQEFGQVLPGTRASLDAVGSGGKLLTTALGGAGKAAGDIAKAYAAAAGAMYNGEKGMKAYNKSIDAGADAVGNLAVVAGTAAVAIGAMTMGVGLLVAGVAVAAKGLAAYAKAANEQSDALFNSYQKLSRVGAAGADSLQGIYNDMQKLGLGVQDLDKFVALVSGSSKELAMMSGSVYKGRKEYAEVSKGMDKFKLSLLNSGMTQDEINEGTIDYLRLQSRAGLTQKKSVDELAISTAAYLKEQDALTQLIGLTRKEQSDQRERLRNDEAFGSQVAAMRLSGDQKQIDAANQMEKSVMMMSTYNEKAAEGMRDLASGNLQTEASQQLMRSSNGEGMRAMQDLKAGIITAEQAFDRIAEANIRTVEIFGKTQGSLRNYNKTFGDVAGDYRLAAAKQKGTMLDNARENAENRLKQGTEDGKALSEEQQRQAELVKTQQNSMMNMQDFVRYGVSPATKATAWFAKTVENATSLLPGAGEAREELELDRIKKSAEEENAKIVAAMGIQRASTNKAEMETAILAEKTAREKRELLDREREEFLKTSKHFKDANSPKVGPNGPIGGGGGRGGVGKAPTTAATTGTAGTAGTPATGKAGGSGGGTFGGSASGGVVIPATTSATAAKAATPAPPPSSSASAPAPSAPAPSAPASKPAGPQGSGAPSADGKSIAGSLPKTSLGQVQPGYGKIRPEHQAQVSAIKDLIAGVESQGNYNTMVGGQNYALTSMTIGEVMQLQKKLISEKKGSAAGKYQMLYETLSEIAPKEGLKQTDLFDESSQERLAEFLIKRAGYAQYAANPTPESKARFLSSLAQTWAGLPGGPDGKSAHAGVGNNKAHISWEAALAKFGDGGIVNSPTFAQVGEKGPEAVIPLKGGKVPVSINGGKNITMGGHSEYGGYNMGGITTDIAMLEKVAGKLGAYDKSTQMITDPKLWKDILKSGMMMNYDLGAAQVGTKDLSTRIGAENVADAIAGRIKELMDAKKDSGGAISQTTTEFASMMKTFYEDFFAKMQAQMQKESPLDAEILATLKDISKTNATTAGTSEKMLRVAQN